MEDLRTSSSFEPISLLVEVKKNNRSTKTFWSRIQIENRKIKNLILEFKNFI